MTGLAERPSRKPPETRKANSSFDLKQLTAQHRSAHQQLLIAQRAELAQLRAVPSHTKASALTQTEIAVEFGHRWAEINRLPVAERAAAAAALRAEQAAALASRLIQHASRLRDIRRAGLAAVRPRHVMERRALSHRHRQAWAAAAAGLFVSRQQQQPARPPHQTVAPLTLSRRLS